MICRWYERISRLGGQRCLSPHRPDVSVGASRWMYNYQHGFEKQTRNKNHPRDEQSSMLSLALLTCASPRAAWRRAVLVMSRLTSMRATTNSPDRRVPAEQKYGMHWAVKVSCIPPAAYVCHYYCPLTLLAALRCVPVVLRCCLFVSPVLSSHHFRNHGFFFIR